MFSICRSFALMQERWGAIYMSVPWGHCLIIRPCLTFPPSPSATFLPCCFPISPTPPPLLFVHLWVTFLSIFLSQTLFLHLSSLCPSFWGQISSLTGWLGYCGCPCWHAHKNTQIHTVDGFAGDWDCIRMKQRRTANNDMDLPQRRSWIILHWRWLADCTTSYLACCSA